MTITLDLRVVELLSSRLCHDLVSPVGAVSNGVELLTEMGADEEALSLVGQSAQAASTRLKFYRVAYGAAGGDLPPAELHDLMAAVLRDRHVSLNWDAAAPAPLGPAGQKLALNMMALALEGLPRGGSLTVTMAAHPGSIMVQADGAGAGLPDGVREAVDATLALENLTARTIQAYFTGRLAAALGRNLAVASESGRFILQA
jgi:histidine phosphotransferase ChpT